MRYLILATDTYQGGTTVYWSSLGWTHRRDCATRMIAGKVSAKLHEFHTSPDITNRFHDIVEVAA